MGLQFPAARRRAAGREGVLAAASSALLAAPDADAVRRVAAAAIAELLGLEVPAGEPLTGEELVPPEARRALGILRAQAALALDRAELAAELGRWSSIDPLTGLANRAAFSGRLRETLATLDPHGPAPAWGRDGRWRRGPPAAAWRTPPGWPARSAGRCWTAGPARRPARPGQGLGPPGRGGSRGLRGPRAGPAPRR